MAATAASSGGSALEEVRGAAEVEYEVLYHDEHGKLGRNKARARKGDGPMVGVVVQGRAEPEKGGTWIVKRGDGGERAVFEWLREEHEEHGHDEHDDHEDELTEAAEELFEMIEGMREEIRELREMVEELHHALHERNERNERDEREAPRRGGRRRGELPQRRGR